MKKAYVKVKPKNVRRSFGKAYIIAAALSAVLCATVFSFLLHPDDEITKDIKIDVPDVKPEESAQVSEPIEIEIPITEEIKETPEVEVAEPETKAEETASFGNAEMKFLMPVSGQIINDYSGTKPVKSKTMGDWRVHSGVDIQAPHGTKVCAPFDGKIIVAENNKLTGKTVSIEHSNGFVSTLYNLDTITVEIKGQVKAGEAVGTVGNSALLEAQEEPHVHFELRKDGKTVNPKDYIKE